VCRKEYPLQAVSWWWFERCDLGKLRIWLEEMSARFSRRDYLKMRSTMNNATFGNAQQTKTNEKVDSVTEMRATALLQLWGITLHPAIDCCVIYRKPSLFHDLLYISIAE
jgi:hypothetical protein